MWARIAVIGLRRSCEASEANLRCCSIAASSRSSVWLAVSARARISSSLGGTGTRMPPPPAEISAR
jgi:hypothetical protein